MHCFFFARAFGVGAGERPSHSSNAFLFAPIKPLVTVALQRPQLLPRPPLLCFSMNRHDPARPSHDLDLEQILKYLQHHLPSSKPIERQKKRSASLA
jgi:hypothetical protein